MRAPWDDGRVKRHHAAYWESALTISEYAREAGVSTRFLSQEFNRMKLPTRIKGSHGLPYQERSKKSPRRASQATGGGSPQLEKEG